MSDENNQAEPNPPVTVQAGQIQFIQACLPPLVAGDYQAYMTQVIKETKDSPIPWNSDPYAYKLDFRVEAPRFTLNPTDIHSVYPPTDQSGKFDNSLPHVVFTRRTLPWERTLDGKPPNLEQPCPWMGLLLLEEAELWITDPGDKTGVRFIEPQSLPIFHTDQNSLLRPGTGAPAQGQVLAPDLGQTGDNSPWEQEKARYEKERCLAIDLPADLFKAVAPRHDDLPYLAHVRQIDTANKEVFAINDKGWFSLVLGNRMPRANASYRAFLVSLEGFQAFLKKEWKPETGQWVRLAVLGTWRFTCSGSNDFKSHMDLLNFDSEPPPGPDARKQLPDSWLRLPHQVPVTDSTKPQDVVNGAFARGYTAFNHTLRQGEQTVSWYRGPLAPLNYQKPPQVEEPVACADQLLRYDPDTGLFDVTYAAAWQLGRLLALQNQAFALGLNRARQALRARAEDAMRQAELGKRRTDLGLPTDKDSMEDSLLEKLIKGLGKDLENAIPR